MIPELLFLDNFDPKKDLQFFAYEKGKDAKKLICTLDRNDKVIKKEIYKPISLNDMSEALNDLVHRDIFLKESYERQNNLLTNIIKINQEIETQNQKIKSTWSLSRILPGSNKGIEKIETDPIEKSIQKNNPITYVKQHSPFSFKVKYEGKIALENAEKLEDQLYLLVTKHDCRNIVFDLDGTFSIEGKIPRKRIQGWLKLSSESLVFEVPRHRMEPLVNVNGKILPALQGILPTFIILESGDNHIEFLESKVKLTISQTIKVL